ncbi:hypothetical protein PRUPE_7G010700 [Prunus persica]|uniref:RNase H type-1 domain-containing protein n=1 Tax=Prunus persica TaxID=3760 RepID=A0A251N4N3_PRUPE|nr:hypothetical protein PRUPE_7G010700 [Prunus persica]
MDYWHHNYLVKKKNMAPPPTNWIKINLYGSIINSQTTTGFFIRNNGGHVLLAGANNTVENSINVVESVALWDGLDVVIDRGWGQTLVEGDSKLVIDNVLRTVNSPRSFQQIIQDIWHLSSYAVFIRFQHVFRETNFTADDIANLGHGLSSQVFWELGLPLSVCSPFYFELFGLSCPRGFAL